MFKKVFQSLSKALGPGARPEETAKAGGKAPAAAKGATKAQTAGKGTQGKTAAAPKAAPQKSPEELCGLDSKMSKDEVRAQLAQLYKRYNRATSSLDASLREEAETMLNAVVAVREKHFGPI